MGNSDGPPSYQLHPMPTHIGKHSRLHSVFRSISFSISTMTAGINLPAFSRRSLGRRAHSPENGDPPSATTPLCCSPSKADTVAENPPVMPTKIAVVYYSMYGHIRQIALEVKKGLESAGCEVTFLKVPETLPDEVLAKMGAPGIGAEDEVATADKLTEYDGIMFGIPTRFGMAAAQMKAFMDSTGGLWQKGALVGKPAGIFFSTGTQNGGQETTALTFLTQLTHHGMVFVPMGYTNPIMFDLKEPHGGSPYGCGTLAGADGSRQPSDIEKELAVTHGSHFGKIAAKLTAK